MSEAAYTILAFSLRLSCLMLLGSWLLLIHMGPLTPAVRVLYCTARELYTSPVGILLLGGIASVLLEERSRAG